MQPGEMHKEVRMSRKRFKTEQIIRMLREVRVGLSQGMRSEISAEVLGYLSRLTIAGAENTVA